MLCPTCSSKIDGRRKTSPQILPKRLLKPHNRAVKQVIDSFLFSGSSTHSKNAGLIQYVIDYCEQKKIPYSIQADPTRGYYIQKLEFPYTSYGDPETTKAVKFALDKTGNIAKWGGPHKWNAAFLRSIGRLMRDYAVKYHADRIPHNYQEEQSFHGSAMCDGPT